MILVPLAFTSVTEPRKFSTLSISTLARARISSAVQLTGSKTTLIPYKPLAIFYSDSYNQASAMAKNLNFGQESEK
jgi:hypothetical protein